MQTLQVDLAERSYPIFIGQQLLSRSELLRPLIKGRQVAIVTNAAIAKKYLESLRSSLSGLSVTAIMLPDGEPYKNWQSLEIRS